MPRPMSTLARACRGWLLAALLLPLLACALEPAAPVAPGWQGASGGYAIRWGADDIVAAPHERPSDRVYSARDDIARELREAHGSDLPFRPYERHLQLLSVVGPYVSLSETVVYTNPGTYKAEQYRTVDLRDPRKRVSLTDVFPERELLRALLADRVVAGMLEGARGKPATLAELQERLRSRAGERRQGEVYFPDDWLSRFAVHHVTGDRVAVRVAVPYMSGMREETVRELGLSLLKPASLDRALADAAGRRAGFLMKDVKPVPLEGRTRVTIVAR